jgi:hypothetical protein
MLATRSLSVLLAAATALSPLAAVAQASKGSKPRLAVIDVGAGDGLAGIAAKITKELTSAAVKDGTYDVLDAAKVKNAVGALGLKALQDCKGNPQCLAEKGVVLEGARVVTGDVQKDDDSYQVKLWLVDISSGAIVSSVDRDILIASRRLEKDVADAIPALIRGETEASGGVHILVENGIAGARVIVDGTEVGVTPAQYTGKPGKHTLRIEHPDFYPADRFFTVDAGRTTDVSVALVPLPRPSAPPPALAAAQTRPFEFPYTIVGGGVGGVGAILLLAGAVIGAGVASKESDAKSGAKNGVYGITRTDAQSAVDGAGTANLLMILGAVGLLGGGALVYLGQSDSSPAVQ